MERHGQIWEDMRWRDMNRSGGHEMERDMDRSGRT